MSFGSARLFGVTAFPFLRAHFEEAAGNVSEQRQIIEKCPDGDVGAKSALMLLNAFETRLAMQIATRAREIVLRR
ncbi:hypothetical protein [Ensifer adhaerens]|uniref:hypothetical protein n=1 Tax=Ensifer adhaerens TaxID=106592 RepID=UPI001C4E19DA|nr:hypothetical protein [Ensifer adhaerens]MBW0367247.1 hypothetical protein [Ensifer adhaerens]UCM23595.1 hypothetical protein LDL63_27690 [Ensifer adhaerens]